MKVLTGILMAVIFAFTVAKSSAHAQVFMSRSEIISKYGYNYEPGETNSGTKYISYEIELSSRDGGTYEATKVFYFMKMDDGKDICHTWGVFGPASEVNTIVAFYKEKYVEVGPMQWKDYETNNLFEVSVQDGLFRAMVSYDDKK